MAPEPLRNYAYIVASNAKYIPGLNALLNSLDMVGNKYPVHVLGFKLPEAWKNAINAAGFSYPIEWHEITQEEVDWCGEADVLMRKRYLWPSIIDVDAVCILDADMFFTANVDRYLEIAGKTDLVVGCTIEQKRMYADPNHRYKGEFIIDPKFWNYRDLCCAPLFVGRRWYPALKKSWDIFNDHPHGREDAPSFRFRGPDMDALNICLIEAGSFEWTLGLSQHVWTGLHECLMKAHTRAVMLRDICATEDGEEVNIVHGQYWNQIWRGWQIDNQIAMIDREFEGCEAYKVRSRGSWELMLKWYRDRAVEHKVNVNDFLEYIPSAGEPPTDVMEIR